MIKGRSEINGVKDELKRRIDDIDIDLDKGSIKRVGVKFQDEVYKIWPLGFQVEIEHIRTYQPARTTFDTSITDTRIYSPPSPAEFTVDITDSRVDSPPDPAFYDVSITDSRVIESE